MQKASKNNAFSNTKFLPLQRHHIFFNFLCTLFFGINTNTSSTLFHDWGAQLHVAGFPFKTPLRREKFP